MFVSSVCFGRNAGWGVGEKGRVVFVGVVVFVAGLSERQKMNERTGEEVSGVSQAVALVGRQEGRSGATGGVGNSP